VLGTRGPNAFVFSAEGAGPKGLGNLAQASAWVAFTPTTVSPVGAEECLPISINPKHNLRRNSRQIRKIRFSIFAGEDDVEKKCELVTGTYKEHYVDA
jgi:hypothetical protein